MTPPSQSLQLPLLSDISRLQARICAHNLALPGHEAKFRAYSQEHEQVVRLAAPLAKARRHVRQRERQTKNRLFAPALGLRAVVLSNQIADVEEGTAFRWSTFSGLKAARNECLRQIAACGKSIENIQKLLGL